MARISKETAERLTLAPCQGQEPRTKIFVAWNEPAPPGECRCPIGVHKFADNFIWDDPPIEITVPPGKSGRVEDLIGAELSAEMDGKGYQRLHFVSTSTCGYGSPFLFWLVVGSTPPSPLD